MSGLPSHARAVVIGCGIVGNSVAYHLTRLGWDGVLLLDKGPLPNPGGSTGHASNFIYLVDHSREMTALTMDSVRQYREMGVFTQSGGIVRFVTEENKVRFEINPEAADRAHLKISSKLMKLARIFKR